MTSARADWQPGLLSVTAMQPLRLRDALFREILPVDTVVQVSGFMNPEWLIEIEVDAVIDA